MREIAKGIYLPYDLLNQSLIALIIAGATLLIGATTALAQDTESTEEEIINPVDPLVCGDQGVLHLLSSSGHNGTANVKRFNSLIPEITMTLGGASSNTQTTIQ